MKRFRFRLRRLEQVRKMDRRESEVEFAVAVAESAECRARREHLERSLDEAGKLWDTETLPASPNVVRLRQAAEHLERARIAVGQARDVEQHALEQVESRHRVYLDKAREHRVVERLHEKQRQRWREDFDREEQRGLDELFLLQKVRDASRDKEAKS